MARPLGCILYCFFFNDTATTEIYTLSLHDALPIFFAFAISGWLLYAVWFDHYMFFRRYGLQDTLTMHLSSILLFVDRKSTRLNSSHANISYAVFCLKKKKKY